MKWFLGLFKLNFSTPYQRRESKFKLIAIAVLSLVATIGSWASYSWLTDPGVDVIRLQISDAKDLAIDAPVMMKGMDVGRVESVYLDDGDAFAQLEIDGEWYDEIPAGSEFLIGSLNTLLPGNVGIQILPPPVPLPNLDVKLVDGIRSEIASPRFLPRQTPLGLYLAIAAGAVVFAVVLGLALKIAKTAILFKLVMATALAIAAFIGVKGLIPMPTLQEQIDKLPKLSEMLTSDDQSESDTIINAPGTESLETQTEHMQPKPTQGELE